MIPVPSHDVGGTGRSVSWREIESARYAVRRERERVVTWNAPNRLTVEELANLQREAMRPVFVDPLLLLPEEEIASLCFDHARDVHRYVPVRLCPLCG